MLIWSEHVLVGFHGGHTHEHGPGWVVAPAAIATLWCEAGLVTWRFEHRGHMVRGEGGGGYRPGDVVPVWHPEANPEPRSLAASFRLAKTLRAPDDPPRDMIEADPDAPPKPTPPSTGPSVQRAPRGAVEPDPLPGGQSSSALVRLMRVTEGLIADGLLATRRPPIEIPPDAAHQPVRHYTATLAMTGQAAHFGLSDRRCWTIEVTGRWSGQLQCQCWDPDRNEWLPVRMLALMDDGGGPVACHGPLFIMRNGRFRGFVQPELPAYFTAIRVQALSYTRGPIELLIEVDAGSLAHGDPSHGPEEARQATMYTPTTSRGEP